MKHTLFDKIDDPKIILKSSFLLTVTGNKLFLMLNGGS